MSYLPRISGRDCVKALRKKGFTVRRQKGSHITVAKDEPYIALCVPDHDELDIGTLRSIIRQSGLTVEEFKELL